MISRLSGLLRLGKLPAAGARIRSTTLLAMRYEVHQASDPFFVSRMRRENSVTGVEEEGRSSPWRGLGLKTAEKSQAIIYLFLIKQLTRIVYCSSPNSETLLSIFNKCRTKPP